ncbi:ELMO domain-containing protein 2 [Tachypleus tridentatus]|uniref:ELMO domain-containing protein 2 n=1 Tax=Tachypleus tridentatus TaxID=6853 RepID=UPI003FD6B396
MLPVLSSFWSYLHWYIRPLVKWFLRHFTRLCELQRVCYGEEKGAPRTTGVEYSLELSRTPCLKRVVQQLSSLAESGRFTEETSYSAVEYAIKTVTDTKNINIKIHTRFVPSFRLCLLQIYGYKQLLHEVENLRKTSYSSDNNEHEEKLIKLWNILMPDKPFPSRFGKHWSDIGFQGDDPKTDFRGMGLLGLENLVYFVSEYTEAARHVLSHSSHPVYGYSFAIVGINLTSTTYHWLRKGLLKNHFYNAVHGRPQMKHFHQVYCYIFHKFDSFWLAEKPRDIMEFNHIRSKFEEHVIRGLSNPLTLLKLNMAVETL